MALSLPPARAARVCSEPRALWQESSCTRLEVVAKTHHLCALFRQGTRVGRKHTTKRSANHQTHASASEVFVPFFERIPRILARMVLRSCCSTAVAGTLPTLSHRANNVQGAHLQGQLPVRQLAGNISPLRSS
eukprot:717611-Amphidinium_carterae.1